MQRVRQIWGGSKSAGERPALGLHGARGEHSSRKTADVLG
jgi:hypothetical protein